MTGQIPWFAVHVRSNFERKASGLVQRRCGCEVYYPTFTVRSSRRGEVHEIEKPLFPGYFFVNKDLIRESKNDVLATTGVVSIVGVGGRLLEVEPGVMRSLQILGARQDHVRPHPYLREGMRVRVRHGPLTGARGIIVRSRGRKPKLVVSIDILGRSVSVAVDARDVEPDH